MTAPVFVASFAPPAWSAHLVDPYGENVNSVGQSVSTLQYLRVAVKATVNGITPYNPTGDVVQFGFLNELTNTPGTVPASWLTGSWETDTINGITTYVAKILVGPAGTLVPTASTNYWTWLKITDSPEIPVVFLGELRVT